MLVIVNPHWGKTTDRRAGCGRSARPVRREGGPKPIGPSYPYRCRVRRRRLGAGPETPPTGVGGIGIAARAGRKSESKAAELPAQSRCRRHRSACRRHSTSGSRWAFFDERSLSADSSPQSSWPIFRSNLCVVHCSFAIEHRRQYRSWHIIAHCSRFHRTKVTTFIGQEILDMIG
jgi:hypothetical protein